MGAKQSFAPVNIEEPINAPVAFLKQMNATGSKAPYVGNFWPAVECKVAWRDCPAYQDCVDEKCVPKNSTGFVSNNIS